ncbi:AAA family ATPase [Roseococcus sp. DSY-14]|uniref:AAA family ATPase n=1 Tax=Roseococcus sp. DSY-14 TaxID=3369650 RepID=UPI00387A86A2
MAEPRDEAALDGDGQPGTQPDEVQRPWGSEEAGDDFLAEAPTLSAEAACRERGAATLAALLLLRRALDTQPGFVATASQSRAVSLLLLPSLDWLDEVERAWSCITQEHARQTELEELRILEAEAGDPVLAAVRRRQRQGAAASAKRLAYTIPVRSAPPRQAENEFLGALSLGRPVHVLAADQALVHPVVRMGVQQGLRVPAPDAALLAELAALMRGAASDGTAPQVPTGLAERAAEVRPLHLLLADRPGACAQQILDHLDAMMDPHRPAWTDVTGVDGVGVLLRPVAARDLRREVRLDDLPGMGEAGEWARQVAADLRSHKAGLLPWTEMPRGAVLAGPPGTGKSTLVRALAADAGVPLVTGSLAEWQASKDGHLGNLLQAMRETFATARSKAPCVLLIDEIDSFPARASVRHRHRDYVVEVVNALLELLDGPTPRDGVVVVGTCNDPSTLDPALIRPGRLEKVIHIPLPDAEALAEILAVHLGLGAAGDHDVPAPAARQVQDMVAQGPAPTAAAITVAELEELAHSAVEREATGAMIERWCRDARRRAAALGRGVVAADLRTVLGPGRPPVTPALRHRTAIHEAGHVIAYEAAAAGCVLEARVALRGPLSGATELHHERNPALPPLHTPRTLWLTLRAQLAGRAAEEELLGMPSSGSGGSAQSDLALATRLAVGVLGAYGVAPGTDAIWWHGPPELLADPGHQLMLAPDLKRRAHQLLAQAYEAARLLVGANRALVTRLAEALLTRGVLDAAAIAVLIGPDGVLDPSGEADQPASTRTREARR